MNWCACRSNSTAGNVFHKDWYFCHFYIDEADTRCMPEQLDRPRPRH